MVNAGGSVCAHSPRTHQGGIHHEVVAQWTRHSEPQHEPHSCEVSALWMSEPLMKRFFMSEKYVTDSYVKKILFVEG